MFVYYRIPQQEISFRLVAEHHIRALRRKGHIVHVRDLQFTKDTLCDAEAYPDSIGLVHPLFYYSNWFGVSFHWIMEALARRHRSVYGFEVADTDAISARFVRSANHPRLNGIILPSHFSVKSFRDSGVTAALGRVPHGVESARPDQTFDFLRANTRPKILFFATGNIYRKGLDLLINCIRSFPDCTFVLKTTETLNRSGHLNRYRNLELVTQWLAPSALASLYSNCDVFLALHRGGAFELNCLEALAYGLPVLAPNHGAVLDYLNEDNASLIAGDLKPRMYSHRSDHSGRAFQCRRGHIVQQLRTVLAEIDQFKHKAQQEGERIRQEYTWDRAADLILEFTS